ncbi:uncharacterized protein LOC122534431 [Frieseomelitta varia]|uniref:uncharacterized protein LOC122534431 n=1 Tax=Frieseomelitta varia TaxID=561572 RepID=UPI001CB68602|nr:uncharacterized protein LOC122534431 [Frieseomelitta varia]XP_043521003.1 uncharacterized protein LOC122534431 [Frieseomelitta varia]
MADDQNQKNPNNVFLFRLAILNCFKRIAESVSEDAFVDILTILTTLKLKPSIGQKLHKAMCTELTDNMNDDLEHILTEGSLQNGLEKVAKLIDADSSVSEDAWRPPGNVALHLRSLDAQKIKEESELLEKQVNLIEEENINLMKEIAEKRSSIMTMNDNMTESLNKSLSIMDSIRKRKEDLEKCLMLLEHDDKIRL